MTSIILIQKLLTMKLDNAELDRIKLQQANMNQKKHKVINSLKEILENQATNEICRLCLRAGGRRIFGAEQDFDVALKIRDILGIEITEADGKPQHICGDCECTVRKVVQLKQTAETTQWRLQQELDMVSDAASDCSDADPHSGYFHSDAVTAAQHSQERTCGKCRAAFRTQEEFTKHAKLPSCRPHVSYVCESCGMQLKSMSRLKRHRLTHSDSLPHPCAACPYRARTPHALLVHSRLHSGARPARCPLCARGFSSASNLASHRRRHEPPRYHCEMCNKGFTFKVALQNHIASQHSNAKPYNCNMCMKTFSTRKMILRHELKAHNRPKMRSGVLPSYMRLQEDA